MASEEDPYYNRRLRGTKVYEMRHRIVLSVMAVGGIFGVLYHFLPSSQKLSQRILNRENTEPEFLKERRMRLRYGLFATSDTIRESMKVTEDPAVGDN
ncbi:hypothetical protein O3P69_019372 [Scylla paramamosain]|uniref:Uncharacterized protein n=1 Tax=Scylla paramamosain TaxID=85552 RepID=A0AAW0SXC5_SCYPA